MAEEIAQESESAPQNEQSRYCPACGSRVADTSTICLMCGASLVQAEPDEPELEEEGEEEGEEPVKRPLPGWARALVVVGLALLILSAGSFGLFKLMTTEPDEPATVTPTIITTPELKGEMDPRLLSRMQDKRLCTICPITAPSYRGTKRIRKKGRRRS